MYKFWRRGERSLLQNDRVDSGSNGWFITYMGKSGAKDFFDLDGAGAPGWVSRYCCS